MKATWTGVFACIVVIYFGIVHSAKNPMVLLNSHALILVLGGTCAIALLTYSVSRLMAVMDFIIFGFLFRLKKEEDAVARDLIAYIDSFYRQSPSFEVSGKVHPFLVEGFQYAQRNDVSIKEMEGALLDRRNSVKRRYLEDAKILNNIAKYPPHLGLLGAASGMIEMMSGLGKDGVDSIGASMAVALAATLWGVGMNNFVFLPLSDNSMKASEDEIYLRDIIMECCLMMKRHAPYEDVIRTCLNRLSLRDRAKITQEYKEIQKKRLENVKAAA